MQDTWSFTVIPGQEAESCIEMQILELAKSKGLRLQNNESQTKAVYADPILLPSHFIYTFSQNAITSRLTKTYIIRIDSIMKGSNILLSQ